MAVCFSSVIIRVISTYGLLLVVLLPCAHPDDANGALGDRSLAAWVHGPSSAPMEVAWLLKSRPLVCRPVSCRSSRPDVWLFDRDLVRSLIALRRYRHILHILIFTPSFIMSFFFYCIHSTVDDRHQKKRRSRSSSTLCAPKNGVLVRESHGHLPTRLRKSHNYLSLI